MSNSIHIFGDTPLAKSQDNHRKLQKLNDQKYKETKNPMYLIKSEYHSQIWRDQFILEKIIPYKKRENLYKRMIKNIGK